MDAVIDAVGTAREQVLDTYGKWAGALPTVMGDPKAFQAWAGQHPTLHKLIADLGLNAPKLDISFSGTMPTPTRTQRATRQRSRTRSTRANGRGGGGGGAATNERILAHLRDHPGTSAKQIAKTLGMSDETLRGRLHTLQGQGLVTRTGERNKTMWSLQGGLVGV